MKVIERCLVVGLAVVGVACAPGADPRAFGGIPVDSRPDNVVDRVDIQLAGQLGSLDHGPFLFDAAPRAALNADGNLLAVLDSDCSMTIVSVPGLAVVSRRPGPCGQGPDQLSSSGDMVTFIGESVLVADSRNRRFAMVPSSGGEIRWFGSGVYDQNSLRVIHGLSGVSDTSFLVSRRLRPPSVTIGRAGLLAVVSAEDGQVLEEFLNDSPISLSNANTSTGRHVRACTLSGSSPSRIAVANQWMGQIVLLELGDEPAVISSIDVTPRWYELRPHQNDERDSRTPLGGARIACGSEFVVVSYRLLVPQEKTSLMAAQPFPVLEKSRVVVVGSNGEVLFLHDYELPRWPHVGASLIGGGGGDRFVGFADGSEMAPAIAIYDVRYLDERVTPVHQSTNGR